MALSMGFLNRTLVNIGAIAAAESSDRSIQHRIGFVD
jgi:hypothetical protein